MSILKGRKKIITEFKSEDLRSSEALIMFLNNSLAIHFENRDDIQYLIDYRNGNQTILEKQKLIRPEINNKLVINHAEMVTRNVVGYFLGTPIQYIENGQGNKDTIDLLNRYVAYEDKSTVDKEIGEMQSICGTAYRIIYTDDEMDEVPFEDRMLDPVSTFVVYENSISQRPVAGVTYYDILGDTNEVVGMKFYVYTSFGRFEVKTSNGEGTIEEDAQIELTEYKVGGIPIIEYPNNMWRIGDWELCIGLMDAINDLYSGRLDDIDQIVQSLLVFINAEINSEVYDEMRSQGVVMLNNKTGMNTDVKAITNNLDQVGMTAMAEELKAMLYAIIGIPDRNNRSGGGGDTGQAVELRDGWADLEVVARNKEAVYKKAEKQTLKILVTIMNNVEKTALKVIDIDIKFSRNKNNNLLVKTQSYQTLLGTKTLSPEDCLTIVDLVSDVSAYIGRGKTFWGASFAGLEQANMSVEQSKVTNDNLKNPPEQLSGIEPKSQLLDGI